MGIWTDIADWRGPTRNEGDGDGRPGEAADRMVEVRGVVLHIAEGYYEGTIAWQHNPDADVSSHFVVARDGRIAQVVDTDDEAWTQRAGNGHWLSVENEGFTTRKGWNQLTPAQLEANARILAKAHQVYGVPLQVTGSPYGRGLGHHSMGAEHGVDWGHSDCPGPAIKAQKPAIVTAALALIEGDTMSVADARTAIAEMFDEAAKRNTATGRNLANDLAALIDARLNLAVMPLAAALAALGSEMAIDPDELAAIQAAAQRGTAAALTPEALAAAIPDDIAADVVRLLGERLTASTEG